MVSSLPTSTFSPGLMCVPRWRTIMLPERTCSPAYFFTPRRCPFESLPLRTEPPPFLCAITTSLSRYFAAGFLGAGFFPFGEGFGSAFVVPVLPRDVVPVFPREAGFVFVSDDFVAAFAAGFFPFGDFVSAAVLAADFFS